MDIEILWSFIFMCYQDSPDFFQDYEDFFSPDNSPEEAALIAQVKQAFFERYGDKQQGAEAKPAPQSRPQQAELTNEDAMPIEVRKGKFSGSGRLMTDSDAYNIERLSDGK